MKAKEIPVYVVANNTVRAIDKGDVKEFLEAEGLTHNVDIALKYYNSGTKPTKPFDLYTAKVMAAVIFESHKPSEDDKTTMYYDAVLGVTLLGKGTWNDTKEDYKRNILMAGEGNDFKARQFAKETKILDTLPEPGSIAVYNVKGFTLTKDGLVFHANAEKE